MSALLFAAMFAGSGKKWTWPRYVLFCPPAGEIVQSRNFFSSPAVAASGCFGFTIAYS